MKHPILSGLGPIYYGLIWVIIIGVHAAVLFYNFDMPLAASFQDSVVFNVLFAGLGLGYWYIMRYAFVGGPGNFSPLFTLLVTGIFSLGVWLMLSNTIMEVLAINDEYWQFLKSSQIWRITFGGLFYALLVLTYYLIYYNQNLQEQARKQLELSNAVKDAELKMLKFQINPHFIFNGLNSISSLTTSDPPKAQQMVIKLSNFLRYSLGKENKEINLLKDEINNIQLYLDIEKIRFGKRLQFETDIDEACYNCTIPNLILQPLFENAIKHGVQESINTITIKLSAHKSNHAIKLCVSNNFDPDSLSQKGAGIGLKNIQQRLKLIYGSSDLLSFTKEDCLFKVNMTIPQS